MGPCVIRTAEVSFSVFSCILYVYFRRIVSHFAEQFVLVINQNTGKCAGINHRCRIIPLLIKTRVKPVFILFLNLFICSNYFQINARGYGGCDC